MSLLSADHLRMIIVHVESSYPQEACGLILSGESDGGLNIDPCENIANQLHEQDPTTFPRTARTFYAIEPRKIMRAERDGRLRGVYHSHCDVGDYFSAEDRLQATMGLQEEEGPAWVGCDYLVVSVMRGEAVHATLWSYSDETRRFEPKEAYPDLGSMDRGANGD